VLGYTRGGRDGKAQRTRDGGRYCSRLGGFRPGGLHACNDPAGPHAAGLRAPGCHAHSQRTFARRARCTDLAPPCEHV